MLLLDTYDKHNMNNLQENPYVGKGLGIVKLAIKQLTPLEVYTYYVVKINYNGLNVITSDITFITCYMKYCIIYQKQDIF